MCLKQTMERKMFLRNEGSCLWSFRSATVRLTHLVNQKTNKIGGIEDKHEP